MSLKQFGIAIITTIIIYIIYQYVKKSQKSYTIEDEQIERTERLKILLLMLLVSITIIYTFNIGKDDELRIGGEQLRNNVVEFEKSMIRNIYQDVSVGKIPF
jgi:hypothetical protein